MVTAKSFKVEIIVDGEPANEYDDDDDTAPDTDDKVTRYVEAVSGKEFHFAVTMDPLYRWGSSDVVIARCYMDGKQRRGMCLKKEKVRYAPNSFHKMEGEWSGTGSNAKIHKYAFANLQTRDTERTDDVAKMKEKYSKLGIFTIELWRSKIMHAIEPTSDFKADALEPVPEKALKGQALDIATTFKASPGTRPGNLKCDDLENSPFLTFDFKYRSRTLQTLLIIERTPSPVPLEDRDPEELSREELEELVRRQRANAAIKQEHMSLKRERANTSSTPLPALKSSKGANGQTIYHLDSDDEDDDRSQGKEQVRASSPADSEIEVVTL